MAVAGVLITYIAIKYIATLTLLFFVRICHIAAERVKQVTSCYEFRHKPQLCYLAYIALDNRRVLLLRIDESQFVGDPLLYLR